MIVAGESSTYWSKACRTFAAYRGDFGLEIRASSLDALNKRLEDFALSKLSASR